MEDSNNASPEAPEAVGPVPGIRQVQERLTLNKVEKALLAGLLAIVMTVCFSLLQEQIMGLYGRVTSAVSESTLQQAK